MQTETRRSPAWRTRHVWLVVLGTVAVGGPACHRGEGTPDGGLGDGGTGDGGTSDGGAGDGGIVDFQCTADGDCTEGVCTELVDGGVGVCVGPISESDSCPPGPGGEPAPHECCNTGECDAGVCTWNLYGPRCSGAEIIGYNVCATDECASHADCGEGRACIPAGALGYPVASCDSVACLRDSDCAERPGGRCTLTPSTTCCNDMKPRCRYPDSPPISDECPP
jgi:hypothetical protein